MVFDFFVLFFFFFNDTATTEIYTLSLHDALPISASVVPSRPAVPAKVFTTRVAMTILRMVNTLAEIGEHTSELQSRVDLVCRLLLEKKKKKKKKKENRIENQYNIVR